MVEELVRGLLAILGGGFLLFMVLAIAQEWELFANAWLGEEAAPPELAEEERRGAVDAVQLTLSLMRHLYLSGGDPRFAERMPAAPVLVEEMLADVDYLARNHRLQDPLLEHLEVTAVAPLEERTVEVRTREHWRFTVTSSADRRQAEAPRTQVMHARYRVTRGDAGWRVEGWEIVDPPPPEEGTGE
jgi:hypothetical protein